MKSKSCPVRQTASRDHEVHGWWGTTLDLRTGRLAFHNLLVFKRSTPEQGIAQLSQVLVRAGDSALCLRPGASIT